MKILTFLILITITLLAGIGGTTAYVTPESIVAAGNVYVSNVTYDPGAFFTGDTGTVTVAVTNGNANQSIVANHATFDDNDFQLTSGTYDSSSNIGPLQTRTYIFSVLTDATEGSYYPTFSLSLRDADSLFYKGMVRVDNTPLVVSLLSKPDSFTQAKKDTISVQVANPRKNEVKNVIADVSGERWRGSPPFDTVHRETCPRGQYPGKLFRDTEPRDDTQPLGEVRQRGQPSLHKPADTGDIYPRQKEGEPGDEQHCGENRIGCHSCYR